jgi:hypothetical protein
MMNTHAALALGVSLEEDAAIIHSSNGIGASGTPVKLFLAGIRAWDSRISIMIFPAALNYIKSSVAMFAQIAR